MLSLGHFSTPARPVNQSEISVVIQSEASIYLSDRASQTSHSDPKNSPMITKSLVEIKIHSETNNVCTAID